MPLSDGIEDFVAWRYSNLGIFSVRSTYHVRMGPLRTNGVGSCELNLVWSKLWKLRIPSKIKIFISKTLHSTLPCRFILANKHIKVDAQCLICISDMHCFICERAMVAHRNLIETSGQTPKLSKNTKSDFSYMNLILWTILNLLWCPESYPRLRTTFGF
jgi:hypothetical protein